MGAQLNGGGRNAGRGGYRPMAEINVTPFVDIMLVLLIVFMVTAPLLTAGVPIDLPDSNAQAISEEDNKPIIVHLDKEGKISLGETEVEPARLIALLSSMTNSNPDARVYIKADRDLDYGKVMRVLGDINGAGFRKVALISNASTKRP